MTCKIMTKVKNVEEKKDMRGFGPKKLFFAERKLKRPKKFYKHYLPYTPKTPNNKICYLS